MIQKGSVIKCCDNSGAKYLNVIQLLGSRTASFASVGDLLVASVRGANPNSTVKDHEVVRVIITRTKKEIRRKDGTYIRFSDNAASVIDKNGQPRATRVFGPIAREIRDLGYNKIASLAKEVW